MSEPLTRETVVPSSEENGPKRPPKLDTLHDALNAFDKSIDHTRSPGVTRFRNAVATYLVAENDWLGVMKQRLDEAAKKVNAQAKEARRERIATAALQGLLACPVEEGSKEEKQSTSQLAIEFADALIARLDGKGASK
jgi:hypothetical protein